MTSTRPSEAILAVGDAQADRPRMASCHLQWTRKVLVSGHVIMVQGMHGLAVL